MPMKHFVSDLWDYRISPTMRRYVWEVYPSLMYGRFARPPPKIEIPLDAPPQVAWDIARTLKNHPGLDPKVAARIDRAARSISDAQIDYLLRHRDWRVRMCAGWYIGLTKRETYVPRLGELLSRAAPHEVFSYCVALALIGGDMAECCFAISSKVLARNQMTAIARSQWKRSLTVREHLPQHLIP